MCLYFSNRPSSIKMTLSNPSNPEEFEPSLVQRNLISSISGTRKRKPKKRKELNATEDENTAASLSTNSSNVLGKARSESSEEGEHAPSQKGTVRGLSSASSEEETSKNSADEYSDSSSQNDVSDEDKLDATSKNVHPLKVLSVVVGDGTNGATTFKHIIQESGLSAPKVIENATMAILADSLEYNNFDILHISIEDCDDKTVSMSEVKGSILKFIVSFTHWCMFH